MNELFVSLFVRKSSEWKIGGIQLTGILISRAIV